MQQLNLGGLTVRIAGGTDREGGGNGPMLVLLHGFGAPGTDLVPLWRQLDVPAGTRFAFPEAPLSLGDSVPGLADFDSRAWWMIDMDRLEQAMQTGRLRDLSSDVPDGLAEAHQAVVAMLDELEERFAVPKGGLVLGGFSQGAMLACDVALRTKRPLAGLVVMSGTLLAEHEWTPLMPKRAGLPVLQSHGRSDPLLPFVLAERLRDAFTDAGLGVDWIPFNGGHGIEANVLDGLARLVTRTTGGLGE